MYLYFCFGRDDPEDEQQGLEGPVIGPVDDVQFTYFTRILINKADFSENTLYEFDIQHEMTHIDGVWYADVIVMRKCPKFARGKNVTFQQAAERGWVTPFS